MAKHLQILRNQTISADRATAKSALAAKLAELNDGEIALNRYQDGKQVKVLIGFNNTVGTGTKQFILDSDAIPADVQTALDAITGDEGSIAKIKEELIGKDTDLSSADTIKAAKKYAEEKIAAAINDLDSTDTAVAGQFVIAVSEKDGKITVSRAGIASADKTVTITNGTGGAIDVAANVDGTTIVKDKDSGKLSVASSALTQYVGSNAVKVSDVDTTKNTKTISLGINTNDNVLSQSTDGLLASLSLNYDSTKKTITLVGKDSKVISTIATNDFVKDGMLNDAKAFLASGETQEVTFKGGKHTFSGLTKGNHYIGFEFKTSDGVTDAYTYDSLDATTIIDVYVAGNGLALSDHTFSVKKSEEADSEAFLSVSDKGVKVSGVQTAIDTAAAKATTKIADKTTGHVTIASSTDKTDSHTIYTISESDIASDAALTTEVTRATGAEDTIEASVGLNADGSHKTTTGNYTKNATTVVGEIAALDAQVKTNTDAIAAANTDIETEVARAKAAEAAIDTYVGKTEVPEGKTVMGVIVENEETAANAIKTLAKAAGLIDDDEKVSYTAPTASGEFSTTTSVMDMLNHIDSVWNTIDCGTY